MLQKVKKLSRKLCGQVRRQGHRLIQKIDRIHRHATNAPIVSVLIPVYNVEQYLADCLDSVINQSLTQIEIICVNDGSTDHSGCILDEYAQKDSRIKVIHKEDKKDFYLRGRPQWKLHLVRTSCLWTLMTT